MRNAFEPGTGIVTHWDTMEAVLDYIFLGMGVGEEMVPIVMTESVANLAYSRKSRSPN